MPLSMADAKIQARQQLARKGGKAKDVDALARKLMNRSSGTAEYNAPNGQTPVKMVTRQGGDSVQVPSGGRQGNLSNYIDKVLEIGGEFATPKSKSNTAGGLPEEVAAIPQERPDGGGGDPTVAPATPEEVGPLAPGYSWSEILAGTAGVAALYAAYRYLKKGGKPPVDPDAVLTPGDKANDPMKTDPAGTSDAAGQQAEQRGVTTRAATPDEIAAARRMRPTTDVATTKPADIVDAEWEPIKDLPAIEQQQAIAEIRAAHGTDGAGTGSLASPEVQRLLTAPEPAPPAQITDTKALTDQRSPDAKAQSSVEGTGDPAVRPDVPRDNINATISEQVGETPDLTPEKFESVAARAEALDPAAQRAYLNTQDLSEADLARLIERLTGKTGRLIPKGR